MFSIPAFFRNASNTDRIRRQFNLQSFLFPICQFLLLHLLHSFLQGKVSLIRVCVRVGLSNGK